jgi:predicted RNA methylase
VPAADLTGPVPWWTPWPGVGPGHDLLGDLTGRHVVELGCGRGDNASAFATTAATVTAVDHDPAKIADAAQRWAGVPRLRFVHAEATDYLTETDERPDVVVSIFGALSFAGPDLLGLIARELDPAGTLAVSARLNARSADDWASLLAALGFTVVTWLNIPHPVDLAQPPCRVVTARAAASGSVRRPPRRPTGHKPTRPPPRRQQDESAAADTIS